jgi:hypothetical protein
LRINTRVVPHGCRAGRFCFGINAAFRIAYHVVLMPFVYA